MKTNKFQERTYLLLIISTLQTQQQFNIWQYYYCPRELHRLKSLNGEVCNLLDVRLSVILCIIPRLASDDDDDHIDGMESCCDHSVNIRNVQHFYLYVVMYPTNQQHILEMHVGYIMAQS